MTIAAGVVTTFETFRTTIGTTFVQFRWADALGIEQILLTGAGRWFGGGFGAPGCFGLGFE